MEKKEMTTYTSPHTGQTYEIVPTQVWHNEFNENGPYKVWQTEYAFYLNGQKVTWTYDLDETRLAETFGVLEGVYAPWSTSRFD